MRIVGIRLGAAFAFMLQAVFLVSAFAANQAPTATIIAPADGTLYSAPASVTFTANATDPDGSVASVQYFNGTVAISGAITASSYSFTWNQPAAGIYSITAKATDKLGKVGAASAAVQVRIVNPTTLISQPASNAVLPTDSLASVSGTFTGTSAGTSVIVTSNAGHSVLAGISGNTFGASVPVANASGTIEVQVARADGTSEIASVNVIGVPPPVAVITQPTSCDTYTVGRTITITAEAVADVGTISKVEFFADGSSIGLSTTPPYSISATLAAGNHSVWASATNSYGISGTTGAITVPVLSQPPVAQITGPTSGATFQAGGNIALNATASDPDGTVTQVEYFANGTSIGAASASPYLVNWLSVAAGSYTLTAKATDNTGLVGPASLPVSVTVSSNAAPNVSITAPAGGASFRQGAAINVTAAASDSDGSIADVKFIVDGSIVFADGSPPYSGTLSGLALGSHAIHARATDNAGAFTDSAVVNITVAANNPPTVSITSPANGASLNAPADIAFTATASDIDGSIASVEYFNGGTLLGTGTGGNYAFTWVKPNVGSYAITAKATDNEGATTTSAAVNLLVDGVTTSITGPISGASYVAPASYDVTATASTSSGTITAVDFYDGPTLLYSFQGGTQTANRTLQLTSGLAGTHIYTVKATDSVGRASTTSQVTVTVYPAPTISINSPTPNSTFIAPGTVPLSANAGVSTGSIAKVEFFSGTTLIATALSAPYSATWSNVPAGTYPITAKVTDDKGNSTTSTALSISVVNLGLAIESPLNGASVNGSMVMVSGTLTATDNSGVTVNGGIAAIYGNRFYARVPLTAGSNSLSATVTTLDGSNLTQTVSITAEGSTSPVGVSLDTAEFVGPGSASFEVRNGASTSVTVQANGSAVLTVGAGETGSFGMSFSSPGAYPVVVVATDALGTTTTANFVIVVQDAQALDAKLRNLWSGMSGALTRGDKAGAMAYLNATAKSKYGPVFDAVMPSLASYMASLSDLGQTGISGFVAEYAVARPAPDGRTLYLIYFLRDADGVWRLDAM